MTTEYKACQKRLCSGWNTFNTFSVWSHVHLPEAFSLNLTFKDGASGSVIQNGYIGHYEITETSDVNLPGPRSYDGRYTELDVTWRGNHWLLQTATDGDDMVMLITPDEPPEGRAPSVAVEGALLWNRPGSVRREGDTLVGRCPECEFRVYTPNEVVEDPYFRARGPYLVCSMDAPVAVSTGRERTLEEVQALVQARRAEIMDERSRYTREPRHAELYDGMQLGVAWNTVYDPQNDRVISPVSRVWNSGWNGYVLFCWDTFFAGLMAGLDCPELAYANVVEMLNDMSPRGFVPNFASGSRGRSDDRSQPPVGSRTALQLYRRWGHKWFLEEVFDDLMTWNRWWSENRRTGRGLGWGSNAFANHTGRQYGGDLKSAILESGLDNSPMYDQATFNDETEVMNVADAGLNGMYVMDCRSLAEIADELGRTDEARELKARAEEFAGKLEALWDEDAGIYLNLHTDRDEKSPVLSPTNFYPLCGSVATQEQARRMAHEHLLNPEEFWGEWVLPSIARNAPGFEDQAYWRGPVWGPMNMIVHWGLMEYDLPEARRKMAEGSARTFLKEWRENKHVHENYNSKTGSGCSSRRSNRFYHWGGLLALIPLLEAGYYEE